MKKEITVQVKVFNPDGTPDGTVPVQVFVELDEATGEYCYTAEAIEKIDRVKLEHAGIMPPSMIRKLRERFGMSQEAMCTMLGLGARTWTRWETGAVIPTPSMCRLLRELWNGYYTLAAFNRSACGEKRWIDCYPRLRGVDNGEVRQFSFLDDARKESDDETRFIALASRTIFCN